MKISTIIGAIDWDSFSQAPLEWFAYPFTNIIGQIFWPSVFAVVIVLSWAASKNLGVVTAAILLTFGIFGGTQTFIAAPEYSLFFAVICIIGIAGSMLQLFVKK